MMYLHFFLTLSISKWNKNLCLVRYFCLSECLNISIMHAHIFEAYGRTKAINSSSYQLIIINILTCKVFLQNMWISYLLSVGNFNRFYWIIINQLFIIFVVNNPNYMKFFLNWTIFMIYCFVKHRSI